MDLAAIDHVLATTRAVRRRLDLERPVEREVLLDCLRLAVQAPTGGNRQGWRFVVVTDPAKRSALADIYRASGSDYFALLAAQAKDDQTRRVYESARYLADVLDRVPVHVVPCVKGRYDDPAPPDETNPRSVIAGMYGSILPAVWSFMLAARARGLGSVWTTLHLNREREAAELLGIPENVSQVALIPVGYVTGGELKPAARPPVETVTYWDGWEHS